MTKRKALVLMGILAAAAPLQADWLVTREGGRVETQGAWKVKGKLVVFTQVDGTLSSLRLTEVDLEASQKATEAAKIQAVQPPPPPAPPKKKLAVLTDADFKKATPPSEEAAAKPAGAPAAPAGPVSVGNWTRSELADGSGVEIRGTLQNATDDMVVNSAVEVQLYNEAGDQVGTASALLTSTSIQPRGTMEFRAIFPGVFAFSDVKFEPRGVPLDISPAPAQPEPGSPP